MNKFYCYLCCLCMLLVVFQSCNTATNQQEKELSTDSTTLPKEGVGMPLVNYWGDYDFSDERIIQDPNQTEQRIVDFIALLSAYERIEIDRAMAYVYQKTGTNKHVRQFFADKFEFYLYHPNSPMLNELYYESFLKAVVQDNDLDPIAKQKYTSLLKLVGLNKPGDMVSDFTFYTSKDHKEQLSDSDGTLRLLLFYDLTCTHCAEIIGALSTSTVLNQRISAGKLAIIAIEPLATLDDWQLYGAKIPKNWVHGISKDQYIIKNQLFNLRAYPSIYLIAEDGRVIKRDVEVSQVIDFIEKNK